MLNIQDSITKLKEDMEKEGIAPPKHIETNQHGKFQRFGKKKSSWLWVDDSYTFGSFGDFSQGKSITWNNKKFFKSLSSEERTKLEKQRKLVIQQAADEQNVKHEQIAKVAARIFERASDNTEPSLYLENKRIKAYDIKYYKGAIIIPLRNVFGKITSLQFINDNGEKRFLTGGKKKGCFHFIDDIVGNEFVYVGEGYGTMASVHEATDVPCVVTFDAGNIESVIEILKEHYPKKKFLVFADNDIWGKTNTGWEKASNACKKFNLPSPIVPIFPERLNIIKPTDWNDLHVFVGKNSVASQIKEKIASITYPEEKKTDTKKEELLPYQYDPEPYEILVDGSFILREISDIIREYVSLPEEAADAIALYILYTYKHTLFTISPKLTITSPVKRCGKSTLLTIIAKMVRRPLVTSNLSQAVIYRAIEEFSPTLIIDEADTFLRNNDEMTGIINSSHNIEMAKVFRIEGDKNSLKGYKTFAPIIIAAIGKLKDTLVDRSVIIPMQRAKKSEALNKFRLTNNNEQFDDIPSKIVRFWDGALCNFHSASSIVREKFKTLPASISDRAADNWFSLLVIAELVDSGGEWPERAWKAMIELSSDKEKEDNSSSERLLNDIRMIISTESGDKIKSQDLLTKLIEIDDAPWSCWSNYQPITTRHLASLLRPFQIRPTTKRFNDGLNKGYDFSNFNDAFERYLPSLSVTTKQPSTANIFQDSISVTDTSSVTDKELTEAE